MMIALRRVRSASCRPFQLSYNLLRSESLSPTVIGSLTYVRCLALLPLLGVKSINTKNTVIEGLTRIKRSIAGKERFRKYSY